ncbi:MAG: Gfo/Idh/MocA family protein [Solirubrobacterales bacterium]
MSNPVRIGMVGLGYWGPNVARNLDALAGCELTWCCDADDAARDKWSRVYKETRFTHDLDELLNDSQLDAVAITTPVPTHASLAETAIEAGKHCFVEKPLAQNVADAERVAALAEEHGKVLMVGHLLEYHPGVQQLREMIQEGSLGDIRYMYAQRLNLGRLRLDENALWSLGAHDVSVLLSLADELPTEVSARGEAYITEGVEDVVFGYLRFESGLAGHLHLSWLDPHKERKITVVGSRRMASLNDMEMERKLTVYDKGFDPQQSSFGDREYVTRAAGIWSPPIPHREPLAIECEHFVDCVRNGATPRSDGASGARVVRVLEALQASLDAGGAPQPVGAVTTATGA